MAVSIIDGDLIVRGAVRANSLPLPSNSVGNTQFTAADPLDADKQEHQFVKGLAQAHGTAAVAERRVVHVAHAAGEVVEFEAGVSVACIGDSTITADLRKNGSTVLSATAQIDSGDAAFAKVAGTFSSTTYSAGDVFEVVVTVSAGTGTLGQGLFASATFREAAD